jgi:metallophosphoesterase superfamily enzyme
MNHYAGIDVSLECSSVCVVDANGERAVMPAFGAYTGGLSIRDAAIAKIFQTAGFISACARRREAAHHCRLALLLSNHRVNGEVFSPLR